MRPVRIEEGGFEIEAAYLAEQFRLDPSEVPELLRSQRILARCERGEGSDAGRYRLTFRFGPSRLSLIVDESGELIRRTAVRWPSTR